MKYENFIKKHVFFAEVRYFPYLSSQKQTLILIYMMEQSNNNYCVILAGGMGRRLWPCSREHKPKQFLDFFGVGRTQLQQTFDRFVRILPKENILVCTNREHAPLVREQLPDLHEENLLVEPVNRGTAPSVAWADIVATSMPTW